MTDHTITLNENAAQCIKSITKFGEDIYYNICSNVDPVHVPWGEVDWILLVGLCIITAAMAVGFLGLVLAVFSD